MWDVAIRGKKNVREWKSEGVDPTGRGSDYWFRREIVGGLEGVERGGVGRRGAAKVRYTGNFPVSNHSRYFHPK